MNSVRSETALRVRRHQATRLESFVDAALAFAVTLLVISIGHVPTTVEEMLQALRGLPTFAVCFVLITRIWAAHRFWSRHYDIEDAKSVFLSLMLVFLVLIYVYPLRLLFSLMFSGLSGGWLAETPAEIHDIFELRAAYVVFGIGFASICIVFAFLFRHALAQASTIGLSDIEIREARFRIYRWTATLCVTLISIALAMFLPFSESRPWLFSAPGLAYWLLMFTRPMIRRFGARSST